MHRRIAAAFDTTLLFLPTCSDDAVSNSTGSPSGSASGKTAKVSVFVAASFKESFRETEKKLESTHPDIDLVFSFAGSQGLVEQINSGASADVVVTTNTVTMDAPKSGGKVTDTKIPTSNTLVLIIPRGDLTKVTGLNSSLDKAKLAIYTLKAPADGKAVPCRIATVELVRKLSVKLNPVSEEQKVTDVCSKAVSSEADAGIVYRADAVAGGKEVKTIEISGADAIANDCPVGMVKTSKDSSKAKAFAECVTSREGQATLKRHGSNEARAGGR